jgi:hypothetical protein
MKSKSEFLAAILTAVLCISGNLLAYSGGNGSTGNPYLIANILDFNQLSTTPTDWDKSFVLTGSINLASQAFFTQAPIAPDTNTASGFQGTPFTGDFNGLGRTISALTINQPTKDYIGLFGYVGEGGQIYNLNVKDVNIIGKLYVGGLVGDNNDNGTLTNCYATGVVRGNWYVGGLVGENKAGGLLTDCYATSSVNAMYWIGGLVGQNRGTLTNCYATGSVNGTGQYAGGLVGRNFYGTITDCYATGAVWCDQYVGGLSGGNYGSITGCYATGSASGILYVGGLSGEDYAGSGTNCYATGSVSGTDIVGGLVGRTNDCNLTYCYAAGEVNGTGGYVGGLVGQNYNDSGRITACFWDINTSGQTTSDGGTGRMTPLMKTLSTFTSAGWDFASVWSLPLGQYPILDPRQMGDLNSDTSVDWHDIAILANHWLEKGFIRHPPGGD